MIDFTQLTNSALVSLYNDAQDLLGRDGDAHVKKFASVEKGAPRLTKVAAELEAMYGTVDVEVTEVDGAPRYGWTTEKKSEPRGERKPTTSIDLSATVTVLVASNPKRKGSRAADTFELYTIGGTGEQFCAAMRAAGHSRKLALSTLHWDSAHGFIKIG